jgi:hypothetical protein
MIKMEGLMEQAQEGSHSGSQVGSNLDDLVAKVKAVAQSSHAELFARSVTLEEMEKELGL